MSKAPNEIITVGPDGVPNGVLNIGAILEPGECLANEMAAVCDDWEALTDTLYAAIKGPITDDHATLGRALMVLAHEILSPTVAVAETIVPGLRDKLRELSVGGGQ